MCAYRKHTRKTKTTRLACQICTCSTTIRFESTINYRLINVDDFEERNIKHKVKKSARDKCMKRWDKCVVFLWFFLSHKTSHNNASSHASSFQICLCKERLWICQESLTESEAFTGQRRSFRCIHLLKLS